MKFMKKRQVKKMKHEMMTVLKKELSRFFGDKRLVLTTILLPGLMIYILYSFMGTGLESMMEKEDYKYTVATVHMPSQIAQILGNEEFELDEKAPGDIDKVKEKIQNQDWDVLLVFPENFMDAMDAYDVTAGSEAAPNVEIYYNSVSETSSGGYRLAEDMLNGYEKTLANKFDINEAGEKNDLAKDEDVTGQVFSMLFPMLMMAFLFSGCMAVAPESIAGEKERGTIATLLVTPMKRSSLATGKILALSIISLLSGISSFVGVMLSLPKLMGDDMSASFYGPVDYMLILFVILTTVLVFVSVISIISAYAKTVKEANTAVTPLMIIVMVLGLTSMFGGATEKGLEWFFVPIYNSVLCMTGIFSFSYRIPDILVTCGVNLLVACFLGFLLNKMFSSEKIMFGK